ncbi:MAG TPA: aminodeoxychorismate/anthranilate synthase component II [Chitinophagales bacterium]|nr:aminodeoxychorismate/anthranilate synthase component II [Chitinophagales bacterium]
MLLLIDNYDSFTYNLQDYFSQLGKPCEVIRNDEKSIEEIIVMNPEAIILSPGPETPSKAGIMMEVIKRFHRKIPVLGICLGHQGIGEFFGASLVRAEKIMHGKTSLVYHQHHPLFENVPSPFEAMRYHSLLLKNVESTSLQIIATTVDHEVMAIIHPQYKTCGIQFHPESILTSYGISILKNWLSWSGIDA